MSEAGITMLLSVKQAAKAAPEVIAMPLPAPPARVSPSTAPTDVPAAAPAANDREQQYPMQAEASWWRKMMGGR